MRLERESRGDVARTGRALTPVPRAALLVGLLGCVAPARLPGDVLVVTTSGDVVGTASVERRTAGGEASRIPGLSDLHWNPWALRGLGGPARRPRVLRESDRPLPHLDCGAGVRLVSFRGGASVRSGFAALGPDRAEVLLDEPSEGHLIAEGGACASPDSSAVAAVTGAGNARIVVLFPGPGAPAARSIALGSEIGEVLPTSLTLTRDSAVFAARPPSGNWRVYRLSLEAARGGAAAPEAVAGPFLHVDRFAAGSERAVAILAGSSPASVDVHVVGEFGAAVNATRSEEDRLPHAPEIPRLAVAPDGSFAASNVRTPVGFELFLHRVDGAGAPGGLQVTADERFHRYIDQESLIFFTATDLVFAGGHEPSTLDVFRMRLADPNDLANLTRTAGTGAPPFLVTGSLDLRGKHDLGSGLLLLEASGFPTGPTTGAVVVSIETGGTVGDRAEAEDARDVTRIGGAACFAARDPSGAGGVWRAGAGGIERLAATPGDRDPVLLAASAERAYWGIPGAGVLEVGETGPPRSLLGDAEVVAPASFAAGGGQLLVGRVADDGAEHLAVDLATGESRAILSTTPGVTVLAVLADGTRFVRGDANGSGSVDVSDPIAVLASLFLGAEHVACAAAADADDDGAVRMSDAVYSLQALFLGGPGWPPPHPEPGLDPTLDGLGCARGS